jgi:hypothetical protein
MQICASSQEGVFGWLRTQAYKHAWNELPTRKCTQLLKHIIASYPTSKQSKNKTKKLHD